MLLTDPQIWALHPSPAPQHLPRQCMWAEIAAMISHCSKLHCLMRHLDSSGVWVHRVSTRNMADAFEALNYLYLIVVNLNISHNLTIRKLLGMFERKKDWDIWADVQQKIYPQQMESSSEPHIPGHHSTTNYSTSLIFHFLILRLDLSKFPWLALKSLCSQGWHLQSSCLSLLRLLSPDPTSTVNFMVSKYRSSISDKNPHLNWDVI